MLFRDRFSISIILLFLLALTIKPCCSEGLTQKVDDSGAIHWGEFVIRCTGVGMPDSESAPQSPEVIKSARTDALEKLLKTLRAVTITSENTVGEVIDADEGLRNQVVEEVKKFHELSVHYMSDGSVEIDVELSLRGELMDLLLPPSGGGERITEGLLCPLCGQPWPEGREVPEDLRLVRDLEEDLEPFSGLVVDARGLSVNPALAPKLLNEANKTVYGASFTKRPCSIEEGIVGYERDLDGAMKKDRVGPKPLVVKGLKARGANKANVVIDDDHTALLHSIPEHLLFMKECRVILLLD